MKKIVFTSSFAFVYLNKEVYSQDSLKTALQAYKEFINPSLKEFSSYHVVKIEPITQEFSLQEVVREFTNYVLGCEFQKGGQL